MNWPNWGSNSRPPDCSLIQIMRLTRYLLRYWGYIIVQNIFLNFLKVFNCINIISWKYQKKLKSNSLYKWAFYLMTTYLMLLMKTFLIEKQTNWKTFKQTVMNGKCLLLWTPSQNDVDACYSERSSQSGFVLPQGHKARTRVMPQGHFLK
jgi:hypothetical protein